MLYNALNVCILTGSDDSIKDNHPSALSINANTLSWMA